jgi:hypothetical protein
MVTPVVEDKRSATKKKGEPLTVKKAGSILKRIINSIFWTLAVISVLLSAFAFSDPKAPAGVAGFFFVIAPLFMPPVHRLIYRAVGMKLAPTKFQKMEAQELSIDEESEFLLNPSENADGSDVSRA